METRPERANTCWTPSCIVELLSCRLKSSSCTAEMRDFISDGPIMAKFGSAIKLSFATLEANLRTLGP